jgi:hypothetical protein
LNALLRGAVVLAGALLWFHFGAPEVEDWIEKGEIARRPGRSANDMLAALQQLPPEKQLGPEQRAELLKLLQGAQRAAAVEEGWARRAAVVLSDAQRKEAEQLEPGFVEGGKRTDLRADPSMVALAQELMAQFGQPNAEAPAIPEVDPWGGYAPRKRVRALRALLQAGKLEAAQAGPLLSLTLQAIHAQELRIDLEEEAAARLPSARQRPTPAPSGG